MSLDSLIRLSACEAVGLLRRGEVSPAELVEAAACRIETVEGAINALPTLCLDRALAQASRFAARRESDCGAGWLAGLPVAVKDLNPVAGVRCTWGSPIYADHIPEQSDFMVQTLEGNGAIIIGKSNTPEFGAGASTFNEVFGKTRNPWNTTRSVAGSSGGSAAALATGEVWLATGSDLGGSLRTPAGFNSVVGLRPSPGRVPKGPSRQPFDTLSVNGPMARNAPDVALCLDAMSERHSGDPLSLERPRVSFQEQVRAMQPPRRIAFSADLGIAPVDPDVARICREASHAFTRLGTEVTDACPGFNGAIECFQTLRAASFAASERDVYRHHRDQLKPEIVWNIEKGLRLDGDELSAAQWYRGQLYQRVLAFFEEHDFLLCPTAIVPPFDVDWRYVEEVNGVRFDNYVEWIAITFVITLTGCPAVSVPAGFTRDGLPVGIQIVGPPREEGRVLGAAHLLEQALNLSPAPPIEPVTP